MMEVEFDSVYALTRNWSTRRNGANPHNETKAKGLIIKVKPDRCVALAYILSRCVIGVKART